MSCCSCLLCCSACGVPNIPPPVLLCVEPPRLNPLPLPKVLDPPDPNNPVPVDCVLPPRTPPPRPKPEVAGLLNRLLPDPKPLDTFVLPLPNAPRPELVDPDVEALLPN